MSSLRTLLGARRGLASFPSCQDMVRRSLTTSSSKPAWLSFSKEQEKSSAHSKLLSKDTSVYEMVTDYVIPSQWEEYLQNKKLQIEYTQDSPGIK